MMGSASPQSNHGSSFEADAECVLRRLQGTFGEILDALPSHARRAQQIAEVLRIDKNLAWRVAKVAQNADPFAAAQYVPGRAALKMFLASANRISVPATLVEQVTRAFADFEQLIRVHAGDRASFKMMLAACAKTDRRAADLLHRRSAFRANSYIWGVQAKTHLQIALVRPADDPRLIHLASVKGFFKLRQLRANAPLIIARIRYSDGDGVVRRPCTLGPIDPAYQQTRGISLLGKFCSQPLPKVRAINVGGGFVHCELLGNGIGDTAAITCVVGNVADNAASRYRDEHNPFGEASAIVCIPSEVVIVDFLIREDTFGPITPEAAVYGLLPGASPFPSTNPDRHQLALDESVIYLGKGPSVLHTPDVPKYPDMARFIFDRLGWDGERFDVYRCRIEYPVVPSEVLIRHDMPDPPGA
ncbi:MAG: hypothetical protein IH988_08730 [Planctomycetes bacterium]|nr:hypothetical protein [Planctomycetota bacterium]